MSLVVGYAYGGFIVMSVIGLVRTAIAAADARERETPSDIFEEVPWFVDAYADMERDEQVALALVALGIGEAETPTDPDGLSFAVVGGVIASLCRGVRRADWGELPAWADRLDMDLWEILRHADAEFGGATDRAFRSAVLRLFFPHRYCPSAEVVTMRSHFASWCASERLMDTPEPIGNLRIAVIRSGHLAAGRLPAGMRYALVHAAASMPPFVRVACDRVRTAPLYG